MQYRVRARPENDPLRQAVVRLRSVSEAIESWRQDGDTITQEQIAFTAGASVKSAFRWCQGKAEPSISHVRRLEELRPGLVRRLFPDAFLEG